MANRLISSPVSSKIEQEQEAFTSHSRPSDLYLGRTRSLHFDCHRPCLSINYLEVMPSLLYLIIQVVIALPFQLFCFYLELVLFLFLLWFCFYYARFSYLASTNTLVLVIDMQNWQFSKFLFFCFFLIMIYSFDFSYCQTKRNPRMSLFVYDLMLYHDSFAKVV